MTLFPYPSGRGRARQPVMTTRGRGGFENAGRRPDGRLLMVNLTPADVSDSAAAQAILDANHLPGWGVIAYEHALVDDISKTAVVPTIRARGLPQPAPGAMATRNALTKLLRNTGPLPRVLETSSSIC